MTLGIIRKMTTKSVASIEGVINTLRTEEQKILTTIKEETVPRMMSRKSSMFVRPKEPEKPKEDSSVLPPKFNYQPSNELLISLITKVAESKL